MVRESKNKAAQDKATAQVEQPIVASQMQVIYADRILNAGFGPVVSRLTLGIEVGNNVFAPFATLVVPTISLMEAMEAIHKSVIENTEMKSVIFDGLDKVKAQLDKTKK